jgi:DNA helicase-2/ATP-dependent DNA helicase PcrA
MKAYDVEFATDDVLVHLAAAGAGKTHAMMEEVVELLKVYRPDEIAFVTFTRKGVMNGIDRAIKANPQLSPDDLPYFQTLHRLAFHESGLKHKNIIERSDIARFNKMLGFHLNLASTFDNQTDDDKMLQRYDAIRSGGDKGVFVHSMYDEEHYDRLISAYENFKKQNDLVDFYDCLLRFKERGKPIGVKVFMIDEAQDLTHTHWEVVEIASRNAEKVRIAGDDFQSLFSYSGASPETLIHLAEKYPTVKHEKSHRLPMAVYKFARGVTKLIQHKVDKDYAPIKDVEGFVKTISDRNILARIVRKDFEDNGYAPSRWYFLFRANHFIADMATTLESFSVPYHTSKGFVIPERDIAKIKRFYMYRKAGYGTRDAREHFMKEYNIKSFDEDFVESDLIPSTARYVYFDYVNKYGIEEIERMSKAEPFVLLATTYKVKGGECDYCAVFMDSTKLVSENTMLDLDSELRVLYVACTRPKIGLYLIPSESRYGMDNVVELVRDMMEE